MNQIDLSELRDIRLPVEPGFWPLANGWYILTGIVVLLVVLSLILWHKHQNKPLPYALKELTKIQKNPEKQLKSLSQLLKRVAMAKYGRPQIAPLTEDSWQEFLLSAAPDILTQKQAHLLAFAMYAQDKTVKDTSLYTNARRWIKVVLKNKA